MGRVTVSCPYCGETAHATVPNNADFYSARKDSKQGDARSTSRCRHCDRWFRSNYEFNSKPSDPVETVTCPNCGVPVDVNVPPNASFYSTRMETEQGDARSTVGCPSCDDWFRFNYTLD
jgi:hypothetical protein